MVFNSAELSLFGWQHTSALPVGTVTEAAQQESSVILTLLAVCSGQRLLPVMVKRVAGLGQALLQSEYTYTFVCRHY